MGLSLSDWLGQVPGMTKRQPARGNPAMHDARDRGTASADEVQKVGDKCTLGRRHDLVATSEGWLNSRERA